ncbi:MAG: dTDP-4-dehydrorhamnose 3,5-epimerase [Rhodobiaceae bacterium]|nr:dTDP-4-dehydrorhamnose 3,5-epimerase [Rhodobiaceae bacterium]|tara:strand:- start:7476 stop:8024 length:549 start_codon:yes stop_codon:yes gene_type:complete
MQLINTPIKDVKLIEPKVFGDNRGFFLETFREDWFKENIANVSFVQDNHSKSSHGILRGLHYQIKQPQGKLVRVISGEVFDVAVDLRQSSDTFGKFYGVILSSDNKRQLWVPEGFAHGFYVISETAEFSYKCTDYYAPEYERSLKWNDVDININWPLVNNVQPSLSSKDSDGLSFLKSEYFR